MDSHPLAHAVGSAPRPWGCSCPLPHGSGTKAGCSGGGGGSCRRTAGGGTPTRSSHPFCARRRATVPPFAHDGTERRIVRPQDPPEQTDCYSGKQKDHTLKNVLLVNALLVILFLSATPGGGVLDLVMELCCALHNFRVRLTPWQPMI